MYFKNYHAKSGIRAIERYVAEKIYWRHINSNKNKKIVVVLHLFYKYSWIEIQEYLKNLRCYDWDLVVTYPRDFEDSLPLRQITEFKKTTRLLPCDNVGYDVLPFLNALDIIDLSKYDIIFKLQSKGVQRGISYLYQQLFYGRGWFKNLFEGCLGAFKVHRIINSLGTDPSVGMAAPGNLIVRDPEYKETIISNKLEEHGLSIKKGYKFVAGTCFAVSVEAWNSIYLPNFAVSDFDKVPTSRGLSLAHALERYFCSQISDNGYKFLYVNVEFGSRIIKWPLKLLFKMFSSERLLKKNFKIDPYYFFWVLDNRLILYKVRKTRVGNLKVFSEDENIEFSINQTVPFRYLEGDAKAYSVYEDRHRENSLPLMSKERFDRLRQSINSAGFDNSSIVIVDRRLRIMDGQHRTAVLFSMYGANKVIDVLQVSIIRKQSLRRIFSRFK